MSSIMGTPASRWPQVTNRCAYEIVTTAYLQWPRTAFPEPKNYENWLQRNPKERAHALNMRMKLRCSGLAYLLPGGLPGLPDIYAAFPVLLAPLARLLAPRDWEGLTLFVLANLDWYLDQDDRRLRRRIRSQIWMSVGIIAISLIAFVLQPFWGSWLLFAFIMVYILVSWRTTGSAEYSGFERAEFYLYISEAYSDPPDERAGRQ